MELTPSQTRAVKHSEGPLLVVAGAGTGKTLVIIQRIAHLISSGLARPEEILALTFSDKAAREMEERLDVILPMGRFGYTISTFHAFGDSVLREKGLTIGIDTDFRVLTRPEQALFLREHLFELNLSYYRPLGDPTRFIDAIITLISRVKDEDISTGEYIRYVSALEERLKGKPDDEELREFLEEQRELAYVCRRYQELMAEKGFVDFGDQVNLTLKLFRAHPRILGSCQERYRFIFVDEFQDTNYTQFQLIRLLGKRFRNIMVVGDDDQSIYKFRGAAISNILKFKEYYPDATEVVLTENFRSTQRILDAAYRLIQNNNPERLEIRNNIDKRLKSARSEDIPILYLPYSTVSDEADGIASLIEEKVSGGTYSYSDFAILVRANKDARPYIRELERRGIPFIFSGSSGLYEQTEVKLLLSFLRVISDPNDNLSLHHLASSDIYNISMHAITICASMGRKLNIPLHLIFKNLQEHPRTGDISDEDKEKITRFILETYSYIEYSRSASPGEILYKFLLDSGYLKRVSDPDHSLSALKIRNVARFFEKVEDFSRLTRYDSAMEFARHIDMLIEAGDEEAVTDIDSDEDTVKALTVHKSKGLEFRVVIMPGLVNERFPRKDSPEKIELPQDLIKEYLPDPENKGINKYHLQEERRLFYVGMTRARDELCITSARDYGGKRKKRMSRFVSEALDIEERIQNTEHRSQNEELRTRNSELGTNLPSPIPEDHVITLSYNQINNYLTCPLKYKYSHILNVSSLFRHHLRVYGEAIHKAIGEYLKLKTKKGHLVLDDLIRQFGKYCIGEGFISKEHNEKRLEEGRRILTDFYRKEEESRLIPAYIEKEFSFFIDNNRIIGRWDRVDEDNGLIKIIDYKSSAVLDKNRADKEARESLQLAIYSLAYDRTYKRMPDIVELRFLGSGITGSCEVMAINLDKAIKEIRDTGDGIRRREFPPKQDYNSCRYCEYVRICPAKGQQGEGGTIVDQ
ncbi:MAG: UvrD-helicase domain-containing protein [Nitrospirae bacterium]|nr:UvrD-helicase domain-containing protein [Nitrospirota bacterium]